METQFTIVYKVGNSIGTVEIKEYTLELALSAFKSMMGTLPHVFAVMPTEVFKLLPDASVFFGIFPY